MGNEARLEIPLPEQAAEQIGEAVGDHERRDLGRAAEAKRHRHIAEDSAHAAQQRPSEKPFSEAKNRMARIHAPIIDD